MTTRRCGRRWPGSFCCVTLPLAPELRVLDVGCGTGFPALELAQRLGLLALGSYWGIVALGVTLPFLIWRLLDEERFLAKNLRGFKEYCAKMRWRLIPGIF